MKKKILSIALVLAGLVGSTAIAQNTVAVSSQKEKTEKSIDKKDRKDKGQRPNPFEGLNLTEKQQADLKALREGSRAEKAKADAQKKADKKEMAEKRQNARKDYLAKIKGILTPEQYVQFLENSYLSNQQPRAMGQKGGKDMRKDKKNDKMGKDGKMAKRGDRQKDGKRGQRPAPQAKAETK